ncbi:hypothetical protein AC578_2456 [Pseudocercospora eumusae]|uniref:Uncharacterized protein n=1 Tax=Pseudocercospora eumusae TaxID=321146 RepID=A0A139HXL5_9PEZI|nr:hypothetical protein AC578_2456 [Pseudocercospora eumusae]
MTDISIDFPILSDFNAAFTGIEEGMGTGIQGIKARLLEWIAVGVLQKLQACQNTMEWTPQLVRDGADEVAFLLISKYCRKTYDYATIISGKISMTICTSELTFGPDGIAKRQEREVVHVV